MPTWVADLPFEELKGVFYQNALMVAQRYKDKVKWIYPQAEIEINDRGYSVQQLTELTRQSFDGARAGAPTMQFGYYASAASYVGYQLNPQPGPVNYVSGWDLWNSLAQNKIKVDYLGLEMQYATVFAGVDLQRQSEILEAYYNVMPVPIHIGETGYSSKFEDYGIAATYWRTGLNQQEQARWADGLLRIAYATPYVTGFYWVHVDPDNETYNSDFLTSLVGVSLFRADGAPKKALAVFQDFTARIKSFTPGTPGAPASIEATAGSGQSAPANALFKSPIQVTVRDFLGNLVPNARVTFTAPSPGTSGIFPGSGPTATAVTNSSGIATAPALAAIGPVGTFQLSASVAGALVPAVFTLAVTAAVTLPSITSVTVANGGTDIAQNAWIVIQGTNLVPSYTPREGVIWSIAPEFGSNRLPTSLGGYPVSVTVNNKAAFLYFFCSASTSSTCTSDQINVLTPLDSTLGPVSLVVTVSGVSSVPFTVNQRSASPALPLVGATSYLVATHADYSLIGPVSLSVPGYPFTPARPGETILLYGFGFGLPKTALTNGVVAQSGELPTPPIIQIGGLPATVLFGGVISPGLYQFNITVPSALPDGDHALVANYSGTSTSVRSLLTVRR